MDQIYSNHPLVVLESRLDWLSATIKPGQKQTVIKGRVAAWMDQRCDEGFKRSAFRTPFYSGTRTDGIAFGEREDDCSITLSGKMADVHGPTLITWADTISRTDVQITLLEPDIDRNWAEYVDKLAGLDERVKSRQLTTRLYTRRPEGITSYIGDGSSDRMLRCYDKHAESEGVYPFGAWRWEVQYRHQRAAAVAQRLLNGTSLPSTCFTAVCAAYRDYRIDVPAMCPIGTWSDAGFSPKTDDDRRLLWLRRSVAPCVDRLTEHFGTETVLDALGLASVLDTLEGQRMTIATLTGALDTLTFPARLADASVEVDLH
jgi:hypothetical protein